MSREVRDGRRRRQYSRIVPYTSAWDSALRDESEVRVVDGIVQAFAQPSTRQAAW